MDSVLMAFESIKDKKVRSFLTMLGIIIGVGAVLILVSVVQGYNADLTAYYEKQGVNKVNVSIINFDRTNTVDQSGEFMDWVSESLSDQITGVTPSTSTSGTLQVLQQYQRHGGHLFRQRAVVGLQQLHP